MVGVGRWPCIPIASTPVPAHLRDLVLTRLQQEHQLLHRLWRQVPGGRLRRASRVAMLRVSIEQQLAKRSCTAALQVRVCQLPQGRRQRRAGTCRCSSSAARESTHWAGT